MTSPLLVVVFALAAFVMTTTSGKDAVKNVDLAEELEKARHALAKSHQESAKLRRESTTLRQQLEKSQEETKEIIQRENEKLRAKDSKLEKENEKLRRQDEELGKQNAELKRKVHELHSEIKTSLRQRDENNTVEVQNVVRNSFGFRQMDFTSELKKTINKQIEKYLDENRMCVTGVIEKSLDESGVGVSKKANIEFGQTFKRIPAFAAALSNVNLNTETAHYAYAQVRDFHVTNSSAVVTVQGTRCYEVYVNWIACMWERSEI